MYRETLLVYLLLSGVRGQGRLLYPPGRSSLWRHGYRTATNHNDNTLSCGGLKHRWEVNAGQCGVCGDPWDAKPRDHESGGRYASGIITATFQSGSVVKFTAEVTNSNGEGFFEFRLCAKDDSNTEVTQECLDAGQLDIEPRGTRYNKVKAGNNDVTVRLPAGLTCKHCVLQWKYNTGDNYGCEHDRQSQKETCGFGKGKFQTEYFGCADIAIYTESELAKLDQEMQASDLTEAQANPSRNESDASSNVMKRVKRSPFPHPPYSMFHHQSSGQPVQYMPYTNINGFVTMQDPMFQSQVDYHPMWQWQSEPQERVRRRVPDPNVLFNSGFDNRGSRVRVGFNIRNNGEQFNIPERLVPPTPALMRESRPTVESIFEPRRTEIFPTTRAPVVRRVESRIQRNFIDPLNPQLGTKTIFSTLTQRVLATQYSPTKECKHCPFDQCLDDKLKIDGLFPGLFDNPTTFMECRRYERLFQIGDFDVVKESLPTCGHPRFRRQIRTMGDDDIGCCATRPQVILPLTVEADNDTFNVVQLGNEKQQFIVQGICGKGNTTACTSCEAENNFQWVLVYDPRVNTQPPVSFVPVKFPHFCRCYNWSNTRSGK
ncbi:uncharacterized protein LOC127877526 [Dreissena polymorpha]|uniref:Chitin-binding type-4 domain-containing protein n=1 Tax=Dreissena polymorpha TaxID=45954 RepID=A0A9D4K7D9_DREPO|nr:uncharacterized protein LOC127877526 [Dreissena polymorpha]KAH3834485.1 hypothetical protein DPMN_107813 [Dreissena polymorpha]